MTESEQQLRPAATVLLLRQADDGIETLMLCRSRDVKFIGGFWVFPGGAVDDGDCRENEDRFSCESALHGACREAWEESGIAVEPAALLPIAHWTAPKESPRRFATWFFVTEVAADLPVKVDGGEIVDYRWFKPEEALVARDNAQMSFLPPTYVSLHWLMSFGTVAEAIAFFRGREPVHFTPWFVMRGEDICNLYEGDVAYQDGKLDKPGPRHRFWMNKKSAWVYENSLQRAE